MSASLAIKLNLIKRNFNSSSFDFLYLICFKMELLYLMVQILTLLENITNPHHNLTVQTNGNLVSLCFFSAKLCVGLSSTHYALFLFIRDPTLSSGKRPYSVNG